MAQRGRGFDLNNEISVATTSRPSSFDIQAIETELPDSDDFIATMISYLSDDDVMQSIMSTVSYQGLYPIFIRKLMAKLQPDAEGRKREISFLVVLMLSRGSSIVSKSGKAKQDTQRYISELVKIYRITKNVVASQSNRETITLPRILNSFPEVGFAILTKFPNINRPVTVKHMISFRYDDFEGFFRGGFVFSIVPNKQSKFKETMKEAIIKAILTYQVEKPIVWSKAKSVINKDQILSEILVYSLAFYMSDVMSEKLKR